MEKIYFIVNPIAGAGRSAKCFKEVRDLLDSKGIDYGIAISEYSGHAIELTKTALAAGESRIVAVGGDGTVNEVASALVGSEAVMGILPFGTGNDLCRTLDIPSDPEDALEVLLANHVRKMDAGTANGRFFLNVSGLGFDVDVLLSTEKFKKRFNGMLPYMLGLLQALFTLKRTTVKVRNGEELLDLDVLVLVAANGRYFGGGMMPAPDADLFDGKLDICIIKSMPKLRVLSVLSRFVKGKHLDIKEVLYFQADEITVETSQAHMLELDGEVCESTPVVFRLLPGALPMLVRP